MNSGERRATASVGKDLSLVSVLIRSAARMTLQRTLDSAAQQDYPAVEIIVVAASGTAHPPLPDTWNGRPLRLVTSDQPLSPPSAGNRLLDVASGDFIAFLDDGDQWKPWHLSTMVKVLQTTPIASLAYSMAVMRDQTGAELGTVGARAHPLTFAEQSPLALHAALIRRELISNNAIARFDESLNALDDLDFVIACATLTPFAFLAEVTAMGDASSDDSERGGTDSALPSPRELAIIRIREKWMSQFNSWQAQPLGQLDLAALYLRYGDVRRAELMLQIASRNNWQDQALLNRFLQLCKETGLVYDAETASPTDRVVEVSTAATTSATTGQNANRISPAGAVKKRLVR